LSCGAPLPGREGPFILKYFLVEHPKRRTGRCWISCAARHQRNRKASTARSLAVQDPPRLAPWPD